mgnify:CR=1 FL=1
MKYDVLRDIADEYAMYTDDRYRAVAPAVTFGSFAPMATNCDDGDDGDNDDDDEVDEEEAMEVDDDEADLPHVYLRTPTGGDRSKSRLARDQTEDEKEETSKGDTPSPHRRIGAFWCCQPKTLSLFSKLLMQ